MNKPTAEQLLRQEWLDTKAYLDTDFRDWAVDILIKRRAEAWADAENCRAICQSLHQELQADKEWAKLDQHSRDYMMDSMRVSNHSMVNAVLEEQRKLKELAQRVEELEDTIVTTSHNRKLMVDKLEEQLAEEHRKCQQASVACRCVEEPEIGVFDPRSCPVHGYECGIRDGQRYLAAQQETIDLIDCDLSAQTKRAEEAEVKLEIRWKQLEREQGFTKTLQREVAAQTKRVEDVETKLAQSRAREEQMKPLLEKRTIRMDTAERAVLDLRILLEPAITNYADAMGRLQKCRDALPHDLSLLTVENCVFENNIVCYNIDTEAVIERMAQAIYRQEALDSDAYEKVTGGMLKLWKTDAPWDTNPDELTEWQRDGYRSLAKAALAVIKSSVGPVD